MYQVPGIKALLRVFALASLLIFIMILLGYAYFYPDALEGLGAYWRAASISVSIVSTAVIVLGESFVYPWGSRIDYLAATDLDDFATLRLAGYK